MRYQAIVTRGDQSWDSIRDTDRQALFLVAKYIRNDTDEVLVRVGKTIHNKLIFGASIDSVRQAIADDGFTITIKDIP